MKLYTQARDNECIEVSGDLEMQLSGLNLVVTAPVPVFGNELPCVYSSRPDGNEDQSRASDGVAFAEWRFYAIELLDVNSLARIRLGSDHIKQFGKIGNLSRNAVGS